MFNKANYTSSFFLFIITIHILQNGSLAQSNTGSEAASNFLSQTMNITVTSIIEDSEVNHETIGLPYKKYYAETCCTVWVSEDNSEVYSYSKDTMFNEEGLEGKNHSDAISEDAAFTILIPVLNYLELSNSKSDYQLSFSDIGGEVEDDLWGCIWIIKKQMELNGVICRKRFFNCIVVASSPTLYCFYYRPIIPPDNILNISTLYIAARQTALTWLQSQPYFSELSPTLSGDTENGVIVIAPNENSFDVDVEQTETTHTYYCWEVPFTWTEWQSGSFEGVVWVDVETGNVVGASNG